MTDIFVEDMPGICPGIIVVGLLVDYILYYVVVIEEFNVAIILTVTVIDSFYICSFILEELVVWA